MEPVQQAAAALVRQRLEDRIHAHAGNMQPIGCLSSAKKFSATKLEFRNPPPVLGQHTDEVLRGVLKLDDAAIVKLRADGIV